MSNKEECPRCESLDVAMATDKSNKRYCGQCNHVWVPGFESLKRTDLLLKKAQQENLALHEEVARLRKSLEKP